MPFDPSKPFTLDHVPPMVPGLDPNKPFTVESTPQPQETPGIVESGLRGAEQGATFGFAPRINAALETMLKDLPQGKNKNLSILEDYAKHKEESDAAMKAAQEAHPYASGAGNLLGGAAAMIGTGGLGLAGEGLAGAAKAGAAYGALSGLGSTKDLSDVGQAATDTGIGAATGAVLGPAAEGAMQVAGPALSAAGGVIGNKLAGAAKTISGIDVLANPFKAMGMGAEGINVIGNTGKETAKKLAYGTYQDTRDSIQDMLNPLKQQATDLLTKAGNLPQAEYEQLSVPMELAVTKAIKQYPSSSDLPKVQQLINDTFYSQVPGEEGMTLVPKPSINYNELNVFKQQLSDMSAAAGDNAADRPTKALVTGFMKERPEGFVPGSLDTTLPMDGVVPVNTFLENKVPGIADINAKMSPLIDASNSLKDVEPGTAATALSRFLDQVKVNPELTNNIPDSVLKSVQKAMDVDKVVQAANQKGLTMLPIKALPAIGGNAMGQSVNTGREVIKSLYNAAPDQLKSIATGIIGRTKELGPMAAKLGNIINQAAEKDSAGRNALFFTIEQNPSYRNILHQIGAPSGEPPQQ